jgi:hypothetical protein
MSDVEVHPSAVALPDTVVHKVLPVLLREVDRLKDQVNTLRAANTGRHTLELALTEHESAWVHRHNLVPKITEALSQAANTGAENPLTFLAAYFADMARVLVSAGDMRAVVKLQRFARGYLSRKVLAESDSRSHSILIAAAQRTRASSLIQARVRRGSARKQFISLQTAIAQTTNTTFDSGLMSNEQIAEITREEKVGKEMTRLAYEHSAQKRKQWFPTTEAGQVEAVVEALRSFHTQRTQFEGEVTLTNPYANADFSSHADHNDPRWWKVGLHNHGPNGQEQLGFFPYLKMAKLLKDEGFR